MHENRSILRMGDSAWPVRWPATVTGVVCVTHRGTPWGGVCTFAKVDVLFFKDRPIDAVWFSYCVDDELTQHDRCHRCLRAGSSLNAGSEHHRLGHELEQCTEEAPAIWGDGTKPVFKPVLGREMLPPAPPV
jgi:hypothetical protein